MHVPQLAKLLDCASNIYSESHLRQMEVAVLCELQWHLARATSVHFAEAYLVLADLSGVQNR